MLNSPDSYTFIKNFSSFIFMKSRMTVAISMNTALPLEKTTRKTGAKCVTLHLIVLSIKHLKVGDVLYSKGLLNSWILGYYRVVQKKLRTFVGLVRPDKFLNNPENTFIRWRIV